jgi:hypothetical protein
VQAIEELDLRSFDVRDKLRALAELNDRVRLLAPDPDKPARPMQLEASPHNPHTGSKKCRREGVPSESHIAGSVEGER